MKLLLLFKLCSVSSFFWGGPFLSLQFYFSCLLIFCQIWNLYTLIPRPFLNSTQVAVNLKCRSSQCAFVHMCMYNGRSRQVCIVYEEWRNEWLGFVLSVSYIVRKVQCITRGILEECWSFVWSLIRELLKGESEGQLLLPSDKALLEDPSFRPFVELYAKVWFLLSYQLFATLRKKKNCIVFLFGYVS